MIVAHVSDLHLGKKSPGDANGSQRLQSFRQALTALAVHKPDVLLIAGDTFDSPNLDAAIVEEAARCLERGGADFPIVIIPGNHDPSDSDKLWATFRKALPPRAQLVLQPDIIDIGNHLIVEAYPCPTRFSPAAPWEKRLSKFAGTAMRVVLAHGTLQGGPVPEEEDNDNYPFTQAEVDSLAADYVALGHFHGVYPPWNGDGEIERTVCYSGTHEPDQFSGDAGYAILADINKGRPTRLKRIKVGKRDWRLVDISGPPDIRRIEELRNEIADDPTRFVIRLRVAPRARLTKTESQELDRLEGSLKALGAHVDRRGEAKAPVQWQQFDLAELPSGAVKEALLSIQTEIGGADEARQELLSAVLQLGCEKMRDAV